MIFGLAVKSLRNRRFTASLTVVSIALAAALLLGVERIRDQSREAFASTVSGTDLIVGARSSPVHLLLFSVFRIGDATNNIRWQTYRAIAARPDVAWAIPLSLGDSHRGFRVLGTTHDYFEHFRFAGQRALEFADGRRFEGASDAVLGSDVASSLGYRVGDPIVVAHGSGDVAFALHSDRPFRVTGVLARTGTPVDRTIHVTLDGLDALHDDANSSVANSDPLAAAMRARGMRDEHGAEAAHDHAGSAAGRSITATLVGLKTRGAALGAQRAINEYKDEPLTAILPGATLLEVWNIVGVAEKALLAVSTLVVVVGLAGMLVALLGSLSERRREMAVLRSVGARPAQLFGLIVGEAAFLTVLGIVVGMAVVYIGTAVARPWLEMRFGLFLEPALPSDDEIRLIIAMALGGVLIGLIPAYRIYRMSLADGMTIRV